MDDIDNFLKWDLPSWAKQPQEREHSIQQPITLTIEAGESLENRVAELETELFTLQQEDRQNVMMLEVMNRAKELLEKRVAELETDIYTIKQEDHQSKLTLEVMSRENDKLSYKLHKLANRFPILFTIGCASFFLTAAFLMILILGMITNNFIIHPIVSIVGILGSIGWWGSTYLWLKLLTNHGR